VSRTKIFEGTHSAQSIEQALEIATEKDLECFVAGGAAIYKEALGQDQVDEMWLSEIKLQIEGDVFFPDYDESKWELGQQEDREKYIFRKWIRKA
jgi:dihydrofolate reductase